MVQIEFWGKKNKDGSYSVSVPTEVLVQQAFVDHYDDRTGLGYQRLEPQHHRRGLEIAAYMSRCIQSGLAPRLFEMTANVRRGARLGFEALDKSHPVGCISISAGDSRWLSIIDGGTRLHGIDLALKNGTIDGARTFDVRLFDNLSVAEEIAHFLLINEKQKRVRTDLGLRVVQRKLDDEDLTDDEKQILETVVPDADTWRFEASRLASKLNHIEASPWRGLIQMPNDKVPLPVKLQAFLTSLKPLLTNDDLRSQLKQQETSSGIPVSEMFARILCNFWNAVAEACPQAHDEPTTNVLWGSIGVSAAHIALAPILVSILGSSNRDLTKEHFLSMVHGGLVCEYAYWFSRAGKGKDPDRYPNASGDGPRMAGAANYVRLAKRLEIEWRSTLHADATAPPVRL